ncbi:MAG TPA: A/G-specific adenine glycosylase [Erysipelotrichaceae bacterium]|nr:A/G-specific adenine glycosylase [Erysipelotrichaceae bacterium]
MQNIEHKLVQWYLEHKRELPFRVNQDPYRVWISEIMAQQTQIDTLIPYYERWMSKYPTLNDLVISEDDDLYKLWEGLGYYSRVRNIKKASILLANEFNLIFPTNKKDIETLPGIGDYTSSAIASICFNEKTAAIDGNVKRVISRLFCIEETDDKKLFYNFTKSTIESWMNNVEPTHLTQALMELGALICNKPAKCEICPLNKECKAYITDTVKLYPIANKQLVKKEENIDVLYIVNKENKFALTLEHNDKLMNGYYRLPRVDQIESVNITFDKTIKHVFSHKIWNINFYKSNTDTISNNFIWVTKKESETLPIITAHRNYLKEKFL